MRDSHGFRSVTSFPSSSARDKRLTALLAGLPHRPLHPDGGGRQDGGVVQVDDHVSQLPLDLPVVHALTGGGNVCPKTTHRRAAGGLARALGWGGRKARGAWGDGGGVPCVLTASVMGLGSLRP